MVEAKKGLSGTTSIRKKVLCVSTATYFVQVSVEIGNNTSAEIFKYRFWKTAQSSELSWEPETYPIHGHELLFLVSLFPKIYSLCGWSWRLIFSEVILGTQVKIISSDCSKMPGICSWNYS